MPSGAVGKKYIKCNDRIQAREGTIGLEGAIAFRLEELSEVELTWMICLT